MRLHVEEQIPKWLEQYSEVESIIPDGYAGGYPKVQITFSKIFASKYEGKWDLSGILKNCELNAGYKTGMAYNLLHSSTATWNFPILTVSGHPEVISELLQAVTKAEKVEKRGIFFRLRGKKD